MNWHYVEQGKQLGPVNDDWILELERSGKINADTLVWREGMTDWKPLREVRSELKSSGLPVNPGAPASTMIIAEAAPGTGGPEAVCAECKRMFPTEDMIRHGNSYICSNCKPIFMQKLSEGASINTGELKYAPIFTRFCAALLDGLILGAVNLVVGLIAGLSAAQAAGVQPRGSLAIQMIIMVIQIGFGVGYETIMIGKYGATLGKMACKIKIVTADGGRVSYGRACGRYFAKLLSAAICMIGYIMALFDKQKRALHDHICNTRVVCK